MRRSILSILSLALVLALSAGQAWAQGSQTGILIGTVQSNDGSPLPGVTVTVTSEALIGERTASTAINGDFVIRGLPPGEYKVAFRLDGMSAVERTANLPLGGTARADATMEVAAAQETIVVTGETPSVLETVTVGANYRAETINQLATARTVAGIAELSPGLTDNTPNADQVTISGGFAYDNLFLINGVDVNDNQFGSPNNLFIEDAIEETQVMTSGISAEFGRFSGGVVNAITKSGGNIFTGAVRTDLTNPAWTTESTFEKDRGITRADKQDKVYSAVLGGPVVKDRLWFFVAGRSADTSTQGTFNRVGSPYVVTQEDRRYEAKLTGAIAANHSLTASYIENTTSQFGRRSFGFTIDPRAIEDRELPNDLIALRYNGVLSPSLFGEVQYSKRKFGFRRSLPEGTLTIPKDSPFFTLDGNHYNAVYFDATDPEDRDNQQLAGALSYFKASESLGSHDLKAGFERFTSTNVGGNSQTATGYVFYADYVGAPGTPTLDSQGRYIPIWNTGENLILNWIPTRGAKIDITTDSFYVNDRWSLGSHWSFNLGARYEKVRSEATGGIQMVDTDTIVPRLGASFDLKGDGKYKFDVTYAEYAGRYSDSQFSQNSPVGNPALVYYAYLGPNGQGVDFAPAYDQTNWQIVGANFPTSNVFVADNLKSPTTQEFTLSAGVGLPRGGYLKAVYTARKVKDFVENFIDTTTGKTEIVYQGESFGEVDNTVLRNSNLPKREYQAVQLQGGYPITDAWRVEGHWTHQFKNDGTFEGEGANTPGISSVIGNYPELYSLARVNPDGRLNDFEADKVRLWTTYRLDFGHFGALDLGLLYRYDSPLTFSYVANNRPFSSQELARWSAAGYAVCPASPNGVPCSQNLFFGERGAGEFDTIQALDLSLNYALPIWKTVEPWLKLEVRNRTNEQNLVTFATTVRADSTSPLDADGLPTGYIPAATFGTATNDTYQQARTFQASLGIRF